SSQTSSPSTTPSPQTGRAGPLPSSGSRPVAPSLVLASASVSVAASVVVPSVMPVTTGSKQPGSTARARRKGKGEVGRKSMSDSSKRRPRRPDRDEGGEEVMGVLCIARPIGPHLGPLRRAGEKIEKKCSGRADTAGPAQ